MSKEKYDIEIDAIWKVAQAFKIQQRESEFKNLLHLIKQHEPKIILEIGAYDGGTTVSFLRLAKKVISIDLKHRCEIKEAVQITADTHKHETQIELLKHLQPLQADVLFIDGDHSAEGSMMDFEQYRQFVKHGGLIVFHDIIESESHTKQGCFVSKTWNTLKNIFKHVEFIDGGNWGGIGVIWNE
jgi:predicted O-methyltransferase YrrM